MLQQLLLIPYLASWAWAGTQCGTGDASCLPLESPQLLQHAARTTRSIEATFKNVTTGSSAACPAPPECISGGYTATQKASHTWDICTGCWSETCVKDVDITSFQSRLSSDQKAAAKLAAEVLDKVHPFAGDMVRLALTNSKMYSQCIERPEFWKGGTMKDFLEMGVMVHECCHMTHWWEGYYRVGITSDLKFERASTAKPVGPPANRDQAFNDLFPTRADIVSKMSSTAKKGMYFKLYFGGPAGPKNRLIGMSTELVAYIQGIKSGEWLNLGVGDPNNYLPETKINQLERGAPLGIAYWSYCAVLYLETIKSKKSSTWQKMLDGGDNRFVEVAKLFLACIDRSDFLLRLYVGKNKILDSSSSVSSFKQETETYMNDRVSLIDKAGSAVSELRGAAWQKCGEGGPAPTPGGPPSTPSPTTQDDDDDDDEEKTSSQSMGFKVNTKKIKPVPDKIIAESDYQAVVEETTKLYAVVDQQ